MNKRKKKKVSKKKVSKRKVEPSFNSSTSKTKIRVIGIGGGGGSIIAEISSNLARIDFMAANTDKRSLKEISRKVKVFQFGEKTTGGFGTGMDPEVGHNAAETEKEKIKKIFAGQDVCVLLACLGGGTSSGAAPVFAKLAKESGCVTYGIFTLPFEFEGSRKMEIARESLEEIKPHLNAISVLPNENIFKIIEKDAPLKEALSMINSNLAESLRGLIEAIYNPGLINIDFADFKTVLEGKGKLAYLNSIVFESSKGIEEAMKRITLNPFYSYGIDGAGGVLLNVTGNKKIGLKDVSLVSNKIAGLVKKNATIILGIAHDEKYGDKVKIMVLGVGCEAKDVFPEKKQKVEVPIKTEKKVSVKKPRKKKEFEKKEKKKSLEKLKINIKPRRNALEIKKASEDIEKEILEEEKKWETPAFLRRK
jgi:cell division protein FtsZ